jgi:hypothetical protein
MNIDATEEDLRAAAEALKLAAILDDRAPAADKARIAAWAEKFHGHRLERRDILDGLQAFYDSPSERAIQIGDLIHHAKQVRRDRNQREEAADLEQRREHHDNKAAAEEAEAIAAAFVSGPVEKTPRLIAAEDALQCSTDKRTAHAAIREYFAAKTEARKESA